MVRLRTAGCRWRRAYRDDEAVDGAFSSSSERLDDLHEFHEREAAATLRNGCCLSTMRTRLRFRKRLG